MNSLGKFLSEKCISILCNYIHVLPYLTWKGIFQMFNFCFTSSFNAVVLQIYHRIGLLMVFYFEGISKVVEFRNFGFWKEYIIFRPILIVFFFLWIYRTVVGRRNSSVSDCFRDKLNRKAPTETEFQNVYLFYFSPNCNAVFF